MLFFLEEVIDNDAKSSSLASNQKAHQQTPKRSKRRQVDLGKHGH
jgi:hypothetical protein